LSELAERGDVSAALQEMRKLLQKTTPRFTRMIYNMGIKACAHAGELPEAELLFSEMLAKGVGPNQKGFGKMIEAAAKMGNLSAAEYWFRQKAERLPLDANDFNQMIQAAGKARDLAAANAWFQELLRNGFSPVSGTLTGLLQACARVGDTSQATSWMAKWKSLGLPITSEQQSELRKVYVKNNDLQAAEEQLRKLDKPAVKDYGMVMDAAARCGNLTAAEFWFQKAQAAGCHLGDEQYFVTLMFAAARAADLQKCERWFGSAVEARLQPSAAMYTALVTASAESLDLVAAEHWLELSRNQVGPCWEATNSALRAAGLLGDLAKAEKWAQEALEDGMGLDGYSYRALLTAAARSQNTGAARKWFGQAAKEMEVELSTCNAAIQAAARAGDTTFAHDMLKEMRALKVHPDEISYRGLLTSASNAHNFSAAEAFLAQAKTDGLGGAALYGPIISCAAKTADLATAEHWFLEAQRSGVAVDLYAFNPMIAAASRVGNFAAAKKWFETAREAGEEPDLLAYTSVISAAGKRGQLKAARAYMNEAIEQGLQPDIILMNSVISAAAKAGDLTMVKELFQQTLDAGLEPTVITFGILISSALRSKNLELAESWLEKCQDFGLKPGADTLTPFISFAAQQRDLKLAEHWFERMVEMDIKPDMIVYLSLISAANKAGEGEAADAWLQRAKQDGILPNHNCFGVAISALASAGAIDVAIQRLDDMVQSGFPADARQINTILKATNSISGAHQHASTHKVLERIVAWRVQPDTLSQWYLERGLGVDAVQQALQQHHLSFKANKASSNDPKLRRSRGSRKPVKRPKKPTSRGQERIYLPKQT